MYTSSYSGSLDKMPEDLKNIVSSARKNNAKNNITGVLFSDHGKFVQVLEGDKEKLHELVKIIKLDKRHTGFSMLVDEPSEARGLANWHMEAFTMDSPELEKWQYLEDLKSAYLETFKISSHQLVKLLRAFINDFDKFT
jgi:hypothetical protein